MKSLKMNGLAVAVLGLVGFAMTGSAFAACTANADPATPNGAWTSKTVTAATLAVAGPGLKGTNCALNVALNAGAASNTKAFVSDGSPSNEAHYRARFYVNTAGLTGLTVANRQARIFSALATTPPSTVGAGAEMVNLNIVGGTTLSFRFLVGDTASAGGYKIVSVAAPDATGNYRIEFDLQQGSPGSFRYWVSKAGDATVDGTPTGTASVTNPNASDGSGWSGVKQANLGLFGASTNFRTSVGAQTLVLDEFDSRRSSFIGL